jgi:hypothetical protein
MFERHNSVTAEDAIIATSKLKNFLAGSTIVPPGAGNAD